MKFALFLGCNIPARLSQYESSARAVLERLNVTLVDIKEFNCCGYPVRNFDHEAFVLSSARNFALAAQQGLDIICLCKCCYGSLKKASFLLKEDASLRERINSRLAGEGLKYEKHVETKHLLSVLFNDVGVDAIKAKIQRPFKDLKIATHYGCHALRPSKVVEFDDPVNPTIFDRLVEATGAKSVDWQSKLECCGAPLFGVNDNLSMDLTEKKLAGGKESGAAYLCTACPYCQMQFDTVQKMISKARGTNHELPSVIYSQLLGMSMGIENGRLGLDQNQVKLDKLQGFVAKE